MESALLCPECGREYEPGVFICTDCGVNLLTGKRHASVVVEPEEEEESEDIRLTFGQKVALVIGRRIPGIFRPGILLASLFLAALGLAIVGFGLFMVFTFGVVISGFVMGAAGMVVYAQAVALLLVAEVMLLPDAMVEFDEPRWTVFGLLFILPVPVFFVIMKYGLA